ncbi:MAG: toll/interleukin-1 receptor domain-containing protein [Clostridia bacterium]|nr:toll/interleukin-1 receptor domain-containing protein [Clostridia bacterium]
MGYAFISYSTKNQASADAIRSIFNRNGIETWMAPYDIPVGSKYAGVITRAIKECACFVLLLTEASQSSHWVDKEVELALSERKMVLPVQLENVVLNDEFTFYIHNNQIIPISNISEYSAEMQKVMTSVKAYTGIKTSAFDFSNWNFTSNPAPVKKESVARTSDEGSGMSAKEMFDLGMRYYNGEGRAQNFYEAAKWFRKAADMGYAKAQCWLGVCYENGDGVTRNETEAAKLVQRAAESGNAEAMIFLASYYRDGIGVRTNYREAERWCRLAIKNGSRDIAKQAKEMLSYLYL